MDVLCRVHTHTHTKKPLKAAWFSLLPHGRALWARIDTVRFPEEGYLLTKYLVDACHCTAFFEEGLRWARQCLSIAQARYPNQDHPDLATSLHNVGSAYQTLEDTRKALAMRQKCYGVRVHPDVADSLYKVGLAYEALKGYAIARQCYEEGLEISEKLDAGRARYVQLFTQKLGACQQVPRSSKQNL
jgi:tetratricopeptide (TPR) repeat protein